MIFQKVGSLDFGCPDNDGWEGVPILCSNNLVGEILSRPTATVKPSKARLNVGVWLENGSSYVFLTRRK